MHIIEQYTVYPWGTLVLHSSFISSYNARVASEIQPYGKTLHTMAFIIPANLEKFEWCLIAVLSLMADQSTKNF